MKKNWRKEESKKKKCLIEPAIVMPIECEYEYEYERMVRGSTISSSSNSLNSVSHDFFLLTAYIAG